jgi:hypothetical protein
MDDMKVAKIVAEISRDPRFYTFGGDDIRRSNDRSIETLGDQTLEFALGVKVADVVRFVLARA